MTQLLQSRTLSFPNPRHLSQLYCGNPGLLESVEKKFQVTIVTREDWMRFEGNEPGISQAAELFELLDQGRQQGLVINRSDFLHLLEGVAEGRGAQFRGLFTKDATILTNRRSIVPKTIGQKAYLEAIRSHDIVFGIGPAGTGKTYLAMAAAVSALLRNEVERIILTRPAVEAGEALGFLPGDLREKILPYLRPLYDALHDMWQIEDVARLIDKGLIEIAPLAYMRGRTLSKAFVILDEAQNTTPEQMMMFLTRLGDGSKMVITGDITQVDLPRNKLSGLIQARRIFRDVAGISLHYFSASDVVRHPLVLRIIQAYERHQREQDFEGGKANPSPNPSVS